MSTDAQPCRCRQRSSPSVEVMSDSWHSDPSRSSRWIRRRPTSRQFHHILCVESRHRFNLFYAHVADHMTELHISCLEMRFRSTWAFVSDEQRADIDILCLLLFVRWSNRGNCIRLTQKSETALVTPLDNGCGNTNQLFGLAEQDTEW